MASAVRFSPDEEVAVAELELHRGPENIQVGDISTCDNTVSLKDNPKPAVDSKLHDVVVSDPKWDPNHDLEGEVRKQTEPERDRLGCHEGRTFSDKPEWEPNRPPEGDVRNQTEPTGERYGDPEGISRGIDEQFPRRSGLRNDHPLGARPRDEKAVSYRDNATPHGFIEQHDTYGRGRPGRYAYRNREIPYGNPEEGWDEYSTEDEYSERDQPPGRGFVRPRRGRRAYEAGLHKSEHESIAIQLALKALDAMQHSTPQQVYVTPSTTSSPPVATAPPVAVMANESKEFMRKIEHQMLYLVDAQQQADTERKEVVKRLSLLEATTVSAASTVGEQSPPAPSGAQTSGRVVPVASTVTNAAVESIVPVIQAVCATSCASTGTATVSVSGPSPVSSAGGTEPVVQSERFKSRNSMKLLPFDGTEKEPIEVF
jgi:hypothetical protein